MDALCLLIMGVVNILCFLVGARTGQKVSKGEEVELPKVNPMEIYKEHQAKVEAEHQQDRLDVLMHNIDSYDGTGEGQVEVPRR